MKKQPVPFVNHDDQGELHFRKLKKLPKDAREKQFDGAVIVGHSETGHHHSFDASCGVKYYESSNPFIAYLSIAQTSMLEHHRSFDDHAAYIFEPGIVEVRKRREYVPEEEARAVAD